MSDSTPRRSGSRSRSSSNLKRRKRGLDVSPLSKRTQSGDSLSVSLTIVAGFAALISLTFSLLIYLKI